jgi:hypothetical protein
LTDTIHDVDASDRFDNELGNISDNSGSILMLVAIIKRKEKRIPKKERKRKEKRLLQYQ